MAGLAVTFMASPPDACADLFRGACDALDQIVHGLDLLHRELLATGDNNRAILLRDWTFPDRFLAGIDVVLELQDAFLNRGRHHGAEGIEHDVAAREVAANVGCRPGPRFDLLFLLDHPRAPIPGHAGKPGLWRAVMDIDVLADHEDTAFLGNLGDGDGTVDLLGAHVDAGVGKGVGRLRLLLRLPPSAVPDYRRRRLGVHGLSAEGKGVHRAHQLRNLEAALEAELAGLAEMTCGDAREIHAAIAVGPIGAD